MAQASAATSSKGRTDGRLVLTLGRGPGQKGMHKSSSQTGLAASAGAGASGDTWLVGEDEGAGMKKKEKKRKRLGMLGAAAGGEAEEAAGGVGVGATSGSSSAPVIPPPPVLLPGLPGPTHYCQPTWPSFLIETDLREKVNSFINLFFYFLILCVSVDDTSTVYLYACI